MQTHSERCAYLKGLKRSMYLVRKTSSYSTCVCSESPGTSHSVWISGQTSAHKQPIAALPLHDWVACIFHNNTMIANKCVISPLSLKTFMPGVFLACRGSGCYFDCYKDESGTNYGDPHGLSSVRHRVDRLCTQLCGMKRREGTNFDWDESYTYPAYTSRVSRVHRGCV